MNIITCLPPWHGFIIFFVDSFEPSSSRHLVIKCLIPHLVFSIYHYRWYPICGSTLHDGGWTIWGGNSWWKKSIRNYTCHMETALSGGNDHRGEQHLYIISIIQHGAIGPLYVTSIYSTWIFCRGVSGFATYCPCDVWCRGLTTCLLHVGPPFGNRFLNNSWAVGLT